MTALEEYRKRTAAQDLLGDGRIVAGHLRPLADAAIAEIQAEVDGLKTAYERCVERELGWMARSDKAEAEVARLKACQ